MAVYAPPIQQLIDEFGRLPGIGPKSAQRIAFYLLKAPKEDAQRLATAIEVAKERVQFCERCFNVSEGFEGDKDASSHRARRGGWKFASLPWIQD